MSLVVRSQRSSSLLDLSSGSGTGLTLLCRSKRGTALFHVKLWWGCAAERPLRLRLSAQYRTEHGDDDPETGPVQVRFHDGRSFSGEETHRGRPLV